MIIYTIELNNLIRPTYNNTPKQNKLLYLPVLSKNEILTKISQDVNFLDIAKAVSKDNHGYKDLFQEGLMRLLEMNESKLIDIYNKKQLRFYFYGILRQENIKSKRGKINLVDESFSDIPQDVDESMEIPEEIKQILEKSPEELLDHGYAKALLRLTMDIGQSEIVKRTGIPQGQVSESVNNLINNLKKKYAN